MRDTTIVLSFLTVILTNCAPCDLSETKINPEFSPYVIEFEHQSALNGRSVHVEHITVDFGDIKKENNGDVVVGWCEANITSRSITVDREYWKSADQEEKEQLIFHELGHCILGRWDHCNNKVNGKPISIMNEYVGDSSTYRTYRYFLLYELFNPNPQCRE